MPGSQWRQLQEIAGRAAQAVASLDESQGPGVLDDDDTTDILTVIACLRNLGRAKAAMAVQAVKAGAFDFIEKPFESADLLARVHKALAHAGDLRRDKQQVEAIRRRLSALTPREREVMDLVVAGRLNKQIAAELDISMKTVENHRANVMRKMRAESLAELVRMAMMAGST